MKVFILSAIAVVAYGTAYTNDGNDYIRLGIIAKIATAGDDTNAVACTPATVRRNFLLRPLPHYAAVAQLHGSLNDVAGSCVNIVGGGNAATTDIGVASISASFALRATATPMKFISTTNALPYCQGAWTNEATGFEFTDHGITNCARDWVTPSTTVPDGLITINGGNHGYNAQGTYHKAKRYMALQIQGPFGAEGCGAMSPAQANGYPVVVPLEASTAAVAADSEASGFTAAGVCTQWKVGANANDAYSIIHAYSTSTAGELKIDLGLTTGSVWGGFNSCTVGNTGFHRLTLEFEKRGNLKDGKYCIPSTSKTDAVTGDYWHVTMAQQSQGEMGSWPAEQACDECPGATPSPAATLHLSAFMAGVIAFIAMMM